MRTRNPKRVVVVTGASAGVGRATVRAFAGEGAHVGLIARDTEGLHVAAREVEELGGKGLAAAADVADADQVEEAAARIENELGPIDVWVNNAMTTVFARVIDVTPAEFKRATEVTYLGTVYGTMAALRRMLPRNAGRIIQVGSALAYRSIPLQAAYCGAKHAIAGFTDSLRTELIHDRKNIHLTMVQLPAMNTPQFTWCRSKMPQPSPARAADLPAGSGRRENCLGIAPQPPGSLRRRPDGDRHRSQQARAGAGRLLSGPHGFRFAADPGTRPEGSAGQFIRTRAGRLRRARRIRAAGA